MAQQLALGDRGWRFILAAPGWIVLVIGICTVASLWPITTTPFRSSILHSAASDPTALRALTDKAAQFGGSSNDIVLIATREPEGILNVSVLNRVRAAAMAIANQPDVETVMALTEIPLFRSDRQRSTREIIGRAAVRAKLKSGMVPDLTQKGASDSWWPESLEQQTHVDLNEAKRLLFQPPNRVEAFLSRDGTSQCIIVRLVNGGSLDALSRQRVTQRFSRLVKSHGLGREELHVVGVVPTEGWMMLEMKNSLFTLLPLGTLLIAIFVRVLFRRLIPVVATLLVGSIAILWSIGFTALVFDELTVLVASVPLLILVISTSDTIHLLTTYFRERHAGHAKNAAILTMLREVGGACLLTSATTFASFGSLTLVPVAAIRQVAVAAAVGVASALMLALCIIPICLLWFDSGEPTPGRFLSTWPNRRIDEFSRITRYLSLKYPRAVLVVFAMLATCMIGTALQLRIDADFAQRFDGSHPLPRAVEFFNQHFQGTTTIEVFIEGPPEQLLDPQALAALRKAHAELLQQEEVQGVISPIEILDQVDALVGFTADNQLPDDALMAAAAIGLARQLQPESVGSLITPDNRMMRLSIRVTPTRFSKVQSLGHVVDATVTARLPQGLSVTTTGSTLLIAESVQRIVSGQWKSFSACFLIVAAIIGLRLRSPRLAFIALIPNILPLLMLAGLLGALYEYVDSDVLMIFTVGFGIAVDDTIHFLHRYHLECQRHSDIRSALDATFLYAGNPIIRTTAVLAIGLLPLAISSYLTTWMLGTFLVYTIVWALIADLLLLPALLLTVDEDGSR